MESRAVIKSTDLFQTRHIGPSEAEQNKMLNALGLKNLDQLVDQTVPTAIRMRSSLFEQQDWQQPLSEFELLTELKEYAEQNKVFRSYLGMGYHGTITPPVILRNIMENPGWYTQYTPYQAEIAQGRLEAMLNFQTMVCDLTAMQISNASLLDEGTAVAEAMAMTWSVLNRPEGKKFFISDQCHPQSIAVTKTRAEALGIGIEVGNAQSLEKSASLSQFFAVCVQYPDTQGMVNNWATLTQAVHGVGGMMVVAADILSLAILQAPGEWGADVVVGTTQRLGVPLGYGGPHAAFLATKDDFKRLMPGRLVGVSKDADGKPAIRLALQTREQHIRRDKATSNICTAQVLLAVIASMYAVFHGPKGIRAIAERIHAMTHLLAQGFGQMGYKVLNSAYFDTLTIGFQTNEEAAHVFKEALSKKINLRLVDSKIISVTLDETVGKKDLEDLLAVFGSANGKKVDLMNLLNGKVNATESLGGLSRKSQYLSHAVFNTHHSETQMLRYMAALQGKDLSLTHSMIPLGSCTMKLNATAEMIPVTWPGFGAIHPFAPLDQTQGYTKLVTRLEQMLSNLTGFDATSLQPNAGSQGEYAGLLVIQKFHQSRGQSGRNVCLIPQSAHGTNPASAALAGMKVVVVKCDNDGNIDLVDLEAKAKAHSADLSALMVTYPSTHGVFEEGISKVCEIIHAHGGQVYMDGANMNAQVGLCRPGDFGPDVCHLNLHKTFSIPHGGGGPGMGPICVKKHLAPFLPGHPVIKTGGAQAVGAVSAAPFGSASILPISYAYIRMMGAAGLKRATEVAILNANYIAAKLDPHYPVLYKGKQGFVAHECIVDLRALKVTSGVEVEDVAKRLMDYGFHAPTISFPVAGTMMIEPTESEDLAEIDRFCEAMIEIRKEIATIEKGEWDKQNNPLKNAPHTGAQIAAENWNRPYSREKAVFPLAWVKEHKFWPPVSRVDNVYGDRNLFCSCVPMS